MNFFWWQRRACRRQLRNGDSWHGHRQTCAHCREEHELVEHLRAVVDTAALPVRAPAPDLRARIVARVEAESARRTPRLAPTHAVFAGVGAAALAALWFVTIRPEPAGQTVAVGMANQVAVAEPAPIAAPVPLAPQITALPTPRPKTPVPAPTAKPKRTPVKKAPAPKRAPKRLRLFPPKPVIVQAPTPRVVRAKPRTSLPPQTAALPVASLGLQKETARQPVPAMVSVASLPQARSYETPEPEVEMAASALTERVAVAAAPPEPVSAVEETLRLERRRDLFRFSAR